MRVTLVDGWPARSGLLDALDTAALLTDAEGRVVAVNDLAQRLYGRSDLALAGRQLVPALFGEREQDQNVVTLSTLHAAKGLEWRHVFLAGINEGLLPFRGEDEEASALRLEEERRLMYVGITRARETLAVSTLRRRKRGREMVAAVPSEQLEKIVARIPVGRLGEVGDVARGVVFLCAEASDFVTGSTLSINGGQHMY